VFTVSVADPVTPSLVARIAAVPAATAVTKPVPDTVATPVLLLAKVIVRPVSVFPLASFKVTTACVVWPIVRLTLLKITLTEATGGGGAAVTVSVAEPDTPSLVPLITLVPTAIAVTKPVLDTVATLVLLLAYVTVRPVSTLPLASFSVTEACVD
jgi:hypothetical protein